MNKFAYLAAAAVIAVASAPLVADDHDNTAHEKHARARLVGVWHISGQPINCLTGQELPVPPITGIIAFHDGGTSTESGPSATPRTPGLGTWHRTGKRQFKGAATVLNFDVNGFSTGSLVVRRTITVAKDDNSFTAQHRTTITDASGVTFERCARGEATRAAE